VYFEEDVALSVGMVLAAVPDDTSNCWASQGIATGRYPVHQFDALDYVCKDGRKRAHLVEDQPELAAHEATPVLSPLSPSHANSSPIWR